jgi:hypothetical protein
MVLKPTICVGEWSLGGPRHKIIFSSRTHSQLSQAMGELAGIRYIPELYTGTVTQDYIAYFCQEPDPDVFKSLIRFRSKIAWIRNTEKMYLAEVGIAAKCCGFTSSNTVTF